MHSISRNDSCACEPMAMGGHAASAPLHGVDDVAVSRLETANAALQAMRACLSVARETQTDATTAKIKRKDVALGQHAVLPSHLGWGNAGVSEQLAVDSEQSSVDGNCSLFTVHCSLPKEDELLPSTITVYPDLLLTLLQQEVATAGRVWLLCRLLDGAGRGWLDVATVRQALTGKESQLKICGWRRLRQILADGKGIFWERDDRGRLWLYGRARVAAQLEIGRFQHDPVQLTVEQLTDTIGNVKAHFYATLHSSRANSDKANPISRETLETLTGVSGRTQQRYDERVGIEKQQAIGVGGSYSAENQQNLLWQGKSTFKFIDKKGQQGQTGTAYIAWHLPNQYGAVHQSAPTKQRRRLNKRLATHTSCKDSTHDLAKHRAQGNVVNTLFFVDGRVASKQLGDGGYLRSDLHSSVWSTVGNVARIGNLAPNG